MVEYVLCQILHNLHFWYAPASHALPYEECYVIFTFLVPKSDTYLIRSTQILLAWENETNELRYPFSYFINIFVTNIYQKVHKPAHV